jgi:polyisoprenoid-binding protein YceI
MKKIFVALFLLLPVFAESAEYTNVLLEKSNITFVSRQMSVPVEGVFKKFSAKVRINPAKPEAGMAQIEIDLASIDAGSSEANDEVKGKSWFSVTEFPKASFVSSSVKSLGEGKFEAAGKLTIKGKALDVHAPFALKEDKGLLNVDGLFAINRLDYGIGSGLWGDTSVVANEVQIKFHLLLK